MRQFLLSAALLLGLLTSASAQLSPLGVWKTVDDETGEAKSQVTIYERNGKLYGKITKILTDRPNAKCEDCPGKKKGQPVQGLIIIEDLVPYEDYWKGGTILDPQKGKEYGLSVWFENSDPDLLFVRGKHWTGLYRTQNWYRVSGPANK
jgi:uncharacterized protein (DUF2147 family)